jgi:hypothetical protein
MRRRCYRVLPAPVIIAAAEWRRRRAAARYLGAIIEKQYYVESLISAL